MQQQPLAFTLVKTVVSARDEGKVLSPALATAWDLLRTELSPAHRVIASEVSWSPAHQEDLKFVIEGVREQFEKDPELENEFLAFLAEVEPFELEEKKATILPILGGIAIGASEAPLIDKVNIDVEASEISLDQESIQLDDQAIEEVSKPDQSLETTEDQPIEVDSTEPTTELTEATQIEPETDPKEASIEQIDQSVEEAGNTLTEHITEKPTEAPLDLTSAKSTSSFSLINYWPAAAGVLLVALTAFGLWIFSGPSPTVQLEENDTGERIILDSVAEQSTEVEVETEPTVEYSAPKSSELSRTVDSLRQAGDYSMALKVQRELAQLLETENSPVEETAQAFSELAILYAAENNILQAIVEQRKSLVFARQAYAKTDPALGRSHLKLASFYSDNKELHMARAHLQQARKIFGQAQELISPTDLENSEEVASKILRAS